ncbi:MinD/ParA family ATP-binding protein [Halogeometricum limi]|uniref:Septum site-determining protein MinD n=1 Tax=Halogeometricum limi TaxID=555875 RepID=A0A1I6IQF0_9EURY|nr:CDP-4-keto-6-deoxy-D-glucose-3-dehydrase [Halogeometricum limi]SFR68964.1 septum site-determining protein MinD [Halogeometricum limi]
MLAIAGGKGGCGKTTTTLGLATALSDRTLVADADTDMPNLHSLAGVPRRVPAGDVGHVHPDDDGVVVCPAPPTDANECRDDGAYLDGVRDAATGPVLVDCPAGAGPDAVAPLRRADGAVLVTPPCAPALRDTVKTAAMADALGTPVVGVVLVRTSVAPPEIASLFGCPILGVVPSVEAPVLEHERVRRAYRNVATELHAGKEL